MTAILWMLRGAAAGAVVGVAMILYIPVMRNGNGVLFGTIIGAIVGLIYGICDMKVAADEEIARRKAENSKATQKQRVKWAEEVKKKVLDVNNICERNKSSDKPLVSTIYQSSSQMKDIMNELTKVAELQGKVDSIADELSKKGGAQ